MRSVLERTLKRLAAVNAPAGDAISFYYFPRTPSNRAHREQAILLKDLLRDTRKKIEASGNNRLALEHADRLAQSAEELSRNGNSARAIFSCASQDVWEEVDLAGAEGETTVLLNSRFHLRPYSLALQSQSEILVVVANRVTARFVRLSPRVSEELDRIESDIPRKARTDGFGGYDAGHKERHVGNWEMRHFKEVCDRMHQLLSGDSFDGAFIACRSEIRPEIEPHLHTEAKDRLLGFIEADPAMLGEERLRDEVEKAVSERSASEHEALVREILGEAQRNGRGALGLRHVLESIERGEAQTIAITPGFSARATECSACGHLDTRNSAQCVLCSQPTRELDDVADALVSKAIGSSLEVRFIDDAELARAGNIGALLRFRADQNTPAKLAG